MTVELGLILLLIVLNGVLSMSEMAIISSRKLRLQQLAKQGDRGAATALKMAAHPTRFLSTVQIGITAIGILSGTLGDDAIATLLMPWLLSVPELAPYADDLALAVTVILITYLSLIIGELVPKRLALGFSETIAAWVARPMFGLSLLALPVVKLLSGSTELVLWLLRIKPRSGPSMSEQEIRLLLDQGTREGVIEEQEYRFIANVFNLDDRRVGSVMTLPQDIVWLDLKKPLEQNWRCIVGNSHEVFPLCDGGLDNIIGFVKAKDVLDKMLLGGKPDLDSLKVNALFVPDSLTLMDLLEAFKRSYMHTALVVDEYGDIHGLVSLDDVFDAIVGASVAGSLEDTPKIVQREDGSWLVDGRLDIYRFREHFHLAYQPEEAGGHYPYQTVGGFIMLQMGRIPKATDYFDLDGFRFEVVDMDGNRVDKVLVIQNHRPMDASL